MNRLNQTEPATFSILSCWAFFWDSVFLYFAESVLYGIDFYRENINNFYCNVNIMTPVYKMAEIKLK
jgi:hypothetical protein